MPGFVPEVGFEEDLEGKMITWPIDRKLGFTVGFAASRSEREIEKIWAMLDRVSLAWTVYVLGAGADVGFV